MDDARTALPFGVFHRPMVKRARWRLLARAESRAAAWRRLWELIDGTGSGDWLVDPVDEDGRRITPHRAEAPE